MKMKEYETQEEAIHALFKRYKNKWVKLPTIKKVLYNGMQITHHNEMIRRIRKKGYIIEHRNNWKKVNGKRMNLSEYRYMGKLEPIEILEVGGIKEQLSDIEIIFDTKEWNKEIDMSEIEKQLDEELDGLLTMQKKEKIRSTKAGLWERFCNWVGK